MKLLTWAAILMTSLAMTNITFANELPPGLDMTDEQKIRKTLGEWILGLPYDVKLRKDQEVFRRLHASPIKQYKQAIYDPDSETVHVFSDDLLTARQAIDAVLLPMGFKPDYTEATEADLNKTITIKSESVTLGGALRYIEFLSDLEITIYPREAGGLVLIRSVEDAS